VENLLALDWGIWFSSPSGPVGTASNCSTAVMDREGVIATWWCRLHDNFAKRLASLMLLAPIRPINNSVHAYTVLLATVAPPLRFPFVGADK
jgi:hypothetical protein